MFVLQIWNGHGALAKEKGYFNQAMVTSQAHMHASLVCSNQRMCTQVSLIWESPY